MRAKTKTSPTSELPARLFKTQRVSRRSFDRFVMRALKAIRRKRADERRQPASAVTLRPGTGTLTISGRSLDVLRAELHAVRPRRPKPRVAATAAAVIQAGRTLARQRPVRVA